MKTSFDADKHEYTINGRPVPSVTEIIAEMMQPIFWNSTPVHLQNGTTVHAWAAAVARQRDVTAPDEVAGFVAAARKFLDDCVVEIVDIEHRMYSEVYQFAGTCDLIARTRFTAVRGAKCIIDYKATLTRLSDSQLGGYSILDGSDINYGMAVQLNKNGSYQLGNVIDLRRFRGTFHGLRIAYAEKARLGLLTRKQNKPEEQVA